MENIIEMTRKMNELCYIMIVKFKMLKTQKVFDISKITRYEVVHCDHMVIFFDETVAQM